MRKLEKVGCILFNVQRYFLLCILYIPLRGLSSDDLTNLGATVFNILLITLAILTFGVAEIIGLFVDMSPFKTSYISIFLSFLLTVAIFEFFFVK
jgi:hypothetical protein